MGIQKSFQMIYVRMLYNKNWPSYLSSKNIYILFKSKILIEIPDIS